MLMNFHFWNKVNKEKIRACTAISNYSCVHKCYKYPQKRCWEHCPCLESSGERKKGQCQGLKIRRSQKSSSRSSVKGSIKYKKVVCNLPSAMQMYTIYRIHNGGSKGEDTPKTTNERPFTKHPISGQLNTVQTRFENLQRNRSLEQSECS